MDKPPAMGFHERIEDMGVRMRVRGARLLAYAVLASTALSGPAFPAPTSFGQAEILARVPTPPGFPEGIAVDGGRFYVAGPATFGTTGKPPSQVVGFDTATGAKVAQWPAQGENLLMEHANSSIALDAAGRIYVLNTQLGIYRLDPVTGVQEPYGDPFPDLLPCLLPVPGPCSPTLANQPPIPNDIAFDPAGNAYVTDSMQATIWKVPAGGGAPTIWFQDIRFASPYIGINGLRLNPARTHIYLTVTTDMLGRGTVYTLPLIAAPKASDLKVFHRYGLGDLPDGVAFGASGLLYVSMATPTRSGVSILSPAGVEVARLRNPTATPFRPYDSPANIAFKPPGSILLTNHAFVTGIVFPSQFTVVETFVGDVGSPLERPALP